MSDVTNLWRWYGADDTSGRRYSGRKYQCSHGKLRELCEVCARGDEIEYLRERCEDLVRQRETWRDKAERAAQEAREHKAMVREIYAIAAGATPEPGDRGA